MSDSQNPENSGIVPQQSGRVVSVDEFKSLFYQLNAKPDTQIRLLPGKKNLELADIRSINEQISAKLRNHELVSDIASINFVLSQRKIKDYCTWAEFERENWDTVNEKVLAITLQWDVAIKLPQYQLPQRHSLKIRMGTAIPPKDMFQLILTSDDIGELMEARTPSICKVDFVNNILADELMNIIANWHEGLGDLPETNLLTSFLAKHGKFLSAIIRYFLPIVLLIIFYQYQDFLLPWMAIPAQITIKSLEALLIWLAAIFVTGTLLGNKVERCIDERIDRFEEYPQFSITRGDKKAVEEFERTNKKLTYQIVARFLWVVFGLVVTSSIKFVIQYFILMGNR